MTKREAQIWQRMRKVVERNWQEISTQSNGNVRAYTPTGVYCGAVVHVYGKQRFVYTSNLGHWEALLSVDGSLTAPRKVGDL